MFNAHFFNYFGNGADNYAVTAAGAEIEWFFSHEPALLIDQVLRFDYFVYFHGSLFDIELLVKSFLNFARGGYHTSLTAEETYRLAAFHSKADVFNHLSGTQFH